jgi:anti-anti-sigma factor
MLRIEITEVPDVTLLHCKGPICSGPDLEHLRSAAFKSCHGVLLVDIEQVDTIDPAGLSFLLSLHDRAERRGGTLAILNPSPWIEEIFHMTQLHSVLRILPERGLGATRHEPRPKRSDGYQAIAS